MPTMAPLPLVAVVPETQTCGPRRTTREYPTTGSHGVPLEKFWRFEVGALMVYLALPGAMACPGQSSVGQPGRARRYVRRTRTSASHTLRGRHRRVGLFPPSADASAVRTHGR